MFDPEVWNINDVGSGNYAAFVYLIQFENSGWYIGMKQIYKGVKDIKKLKSSTKQSNWKDYTSSSKTVNALIDAGENYKKYVLWCFPTANQAALVEATLIGSCGLKPHNLNKAILAKVRLPASDTERLKLFKIVKDLIGTLT
ncbi:TPA: GIY-YIG nuclease family protein [Escherichia coli]